MSYLTLQQHLPFMVLKPSAVTTLVFCRFLVATALTVYGIETNSKGSNETERKANVATALTVYGIETI